MDALDILGMGLATLWLFMNPLFPLLPVIGMIGNPVALPLLLLAPVL